MERRQLECFVAICDAGTMAEAARALNISQPALSQAIKALEREVGAQLFDRLPRGMRPTSAGLSLLDPARQVARDFAIATERVRRVKGLQDGRLDIVTLPGLVTAPLAAWVGRFRKHWPGVTVRIQQSETPDELLDLVRSGEHELGLTIDAERVTDLWTRMIDTQELVAVLPASIGGDTSAPISLDELMGMGLITGKRGTLIRDLAEVRAAARGESWHPSVEIERREAALPLVGRGAGVSVLPLATSASLRVAGVVLRRLTPRIRRPVFVTMRRGPASPAASAFLELAPEPGHER